MNRIQVPFIGRPATLFVGLAVALVSGGVAAAPLPEPYCISGTYRCVDASAPGQPIHYAGTVSNCGTQTLYGVTVETLSNGRVLGPLTLLAGQSADYSGSYVPASVPSTNEVGFRGWDNPAATGDPIVAQVAFGTCTVTPPSAEICRTPGFWGEHAGTEKRRSENITQAVVDAAGGSLPICMNLSVSNTALSTSGSALEALCVSVSGNQRLQLARQLTAASLNCVMTNGDPTCSGVSVKDVFDACNQSCQVGVGDLSACINKLDCFNNGGRTLANGTCQLGTCGGDGATACNKDADCGVDGSGAPIKCVALSGNCHDRLLVNTELGLNFEPPGPAGSSQSCNDARRNVCTILRCR